MHHKNTLPCLTEVGIKPVSWLQEYNLKCLGVLKFYT